MATAPALPKEMQIFAKEFSKAFAASATKEMMKFQKQMEKSMPKDVIGTKRVKSPEDMYDKMDKRDRKYRDEKKKKDDAYDKKYRTEEEKKEDKKRKAELERYYRELRRTVTVREKVERWLLQRFWGRTFLKAWYGFWNLKVLSTIREGISRIAGFFQSQLHDILGDMAPLLDLVKDTFSFLKNTAIGVGEALWKAAKGLYALDPVRKFFKSINKQLKDTIITPFQKMFSSVKGTFLKGLTTLFKQPWAMGKTYAAQKRAEAKEAIKRWADEKRQRAKYWIYMRAEATKHWMWEKTKGTAGKLLGGPLKKVGQVARAGMDMMKWMFPLFIAGIAGLVSSMMAVIAPLLLPVALGLLAWGAGALISSLMDDPAFKKDWQIFTDWIVKKFDDLFTMVKDKALEILTFGLYKSPAARKREEEQQLKEIKEKVQSGWRPGKERTMAPPAGVPTAPVTGGVKGAGTTGVQNIPTRLNNPGNIKDQGTNFTEGLKVKYGAMPSGVKAEDGGTFLQFPSSEAGFAALKEALKTRSFDKTVDERLRQWSNNAYGGEIAPHLSKKRAADLSDDELDLLAKAMAKREGYAGVPALQKGGKITGGRGMGVPGVGVDNQLIRASVGEWVTPTGTSGLLNSILPGGMAALIRDPIGTLMKFASNFTFGGLGAGALMGFQRGGRVSLTRNELATPIKGVAGMGLRNLESQEMMLNKLTATIAGGQQQMAPVPVPVGLSSATYNTSPVQVNSAGQSGAGGAPTDPLPTLMSTPVAWYIVLQNTV